MLRKFLAIVLCSLIACSLLIKDAEAKRFGGGRSFGVSRSTNNFSRSPSAFNQNYSRSQSGFGGQNASPMSRWFGPLAGLLAGGLLASLFMGHGLGSGLLSWLLVGGLLFVLITLFRNKKQSAQTFEQPSHNQTQSFARDAAAQFMRNSVNQPASPSYSAVVNNYPVGFDAQTFLREAKVQFIRLQAAYDEKNLADIREFTTPEVFAEIQLQFHERGNQANKTTVMSLEAELLNVEEEPQFASGAELQTLTASVRFTGLIQEDQAQPASAFNEVWHFKKEAANLRWMVAGVQQE